MLDSPQETVERDFYTKTPTCIEAKSDSEWVLNANDNIYRKRQTGRCRNMSGHTFMCRPAARLETMALVI